MFQIVVEDCVNYCCTAGGCEHGISDPQKASSGDSVLHNCGPPLRTAHTVVGKRGKSGVKKRGKSEEKIS